MKVRVGVYAVYMVLLPIWEERQVQPTVILTVGSWDSPPSLVSGVWVGGEERDIHFDTMVDGQGAAMALPILGALYAESL